MKTEERKHRRWLKGEPGDIEHNALYDAWEAAEARVMELKAERDEADAAHKRNCDLHAKCINDLKELQSRPVLTREEVEEACKDIERKLDPAGLRYEALCEYISSRLPAVVGTGVTEAQPSDEELGEIVGGVGDYSCLYPDAARAVREAVEKPLRAEIERLTELKRLAMLTAENIQAERDTLRAKLEAAESTTTRPARVRFTVTAQEVGGVIRSTSLAFGPQPYDWSREGQAVLDYLAAHAVVYVPEGVPSAEEVAKMLCAKSNISWEAITPLGREGRIEAAQDLLDVLAPYLQPAASVDPTLCEEPLRRGEPNTPGKYQVSLYKDGDMFGMNFTEYGIGKSWWDNAEAAYEQGMWLLSFAARTRDVRLPIRDAAPAPSDDTRQQQREEARELLKRLSDSLMTTHGIDARKRAKWAGLLAELDAALRKDGE